MNTLTKVTKETKGLAGRWTAKSLMPFVLLKVIYYFYAGGENEN